MSPKLRSFLARAALVGGIAFVASHLARTAPKEQSLLVRLNSRQVSRVEGVITREGEPEPAAGFSRDFLGVSPGVVRHTFSAPNDTYIVVITLRDRLSPVLAGEASGAIAPIPKETSFERRVSLVGGEVIVSPD